MTQEQIKAEAAQIVSDTLLVQKAVRQGLLTSREAFMARYGIQKRMEALEDRWIKVVHNLDRKGGG